jgi:hypothetical protein
MRVCRHCSRENGEDNIRCLECGFDLGDSPPLDVPSQVGERSSRFFRWRPASIILIIFVVLYWVLALLNLWMARTFSHRGEEQMARLMYWGTFWNVVVAVLCAVGRQMMRRQTRLSLLAGALAVMAALFVVIRTWAAGLLSGHNPLPTIEALLIWMPLTYVIIYAYRESRGTQANNHSTWHRLLRFPVMIPRKTSIQSIRLALRPRHVYEQAPSIEHPHCRPARLANL